jgi:hypothetical protein
LQSFSNLLEIFKDMYENKIVSGGQVSKLHNVNGTQNPRKLTNKTCQNMSLLR